MDAECPAVLQHVLQHRMGLGEKDVLEESLVRWDAEECLTQGDVGHEVRHPIGREVVELSPEVHDVAKGIGRTCPCPGKK